MALVFCDSFEHYTSAQMTRKWTTASSQPTLSADANSRFPGSRYFNGLNDRSWSVEYFMPNAVTYIVGMAIRFKDPGGIIPGRRWIALGDSGTEHCRLYINSNQQLYVDRNGTALTTGSTVLVEGQWYYVEWKLTVDDSSGYSEVRVNGVIDSTFSGDTRNGANAYSNRLLLTAHYSAGPDNGYYMGIDDLYICNTSGAANNDFLGDLRVECLFPSGNGNSSQFVGSDADSTDNYLLVDEQDSDDETTYVESNTLTNKDTYAYGDLATTSGTVFGVQVLPLLRKTDAGDRKAVSVARLSGTEVDSANKVVLDNYFYRPDIRETKPGGGAWTVSDVNNAEFGIKVA